MRNRSYNRVMENEKKYLPEKVETYEELKNVFEEFHIDSDKTRFYIGDDYTDPKAFVIYQDDFGDFVVYKMKADGTRALRYKGSNEKHAVNEYYQKFLEEVSKRPEFARKLLRPAATRSGFNSGINRKNRTRLIIIPIICIWLVSAALGVGGLLYRRYKHRHDGYYVTPSGTYYTQGHDVYYYDNDDWYYYGPYDTFYDNYYDDYDYYEDYSYTEDYSDFSDSYYYDDDSWSSSDSDSGWDSDDSWDSWDSGGSDWDSDW